MTLLNRLARQLGQGGDRIPGHTFESSMQLYLTGATGVTRAKILGFYGIPDPSALATDFDKFKTKYDTLLAVAKGEWLHQLMACVILLQYEEKNPGKGITKSQFNTILGLDLDEA